MNNFVKSALVAGLVAASAGSAFAAPIWQVNPENGRLVRSLSAPAESSAAYHGPAKQGGYLIVEDLSNDSAKRVARHQALTEGRASHQASGNVNSYVPRLLQPSAK